MTRIRSSLAVTVVASAILSSAAPAPAIPPADSVGQLIGTWGLAPVDGRVSGSFFAVSRSETGKTFADLSVNPTGWHCTLENREVTWNDRSSRFEWSSGSKGGKGSSCWMAATPKGDKLDLRIWCPDSCTDGERPHELTLERIADVRLIPPVGTVRTFCSTHDALRLQFCVPGAVRDAVARVRRAAEKWDVLTDLNAATSLGMEKVMLDVLASCRARGGDGLCLQQGLRARAEELESAVTHRQSSLADERRTSEAAAVSLARAEERKAWEGTWYLVNDEMVGTLTIEGCDDRQCRIQLAGTTNYEFGVDRRGQCTFDDADKPTVRYLGTNKAFAYLEPVEDAVNAEGAGPFANFCRIDLERVGDGVRVRWRGPGCQLRCMEAPGESLSGDYHPVQAPTYSCAEEPAEMWFDEALPCLDPELARLDREMASAYERARARAAGASREKLARAQRDWLRARRDGCEQGGERRTCLVEAYRKRIQELTTR